MWADETASPGLPPTAPRGSPSRRGRARHLLTPRETGAGRSRRTAPPRGSRARSVRIGADDLAAAGAAERHVGDAVDAVLEELDRSVAEQEVHTARVEALEPLARVAEPASPDVRAPTHRAAGILARDPR